MKRFQSFAELVKEAGSLCSVWVNIEGKPVTILELVDAMDKNPDLEAPKAYVLSEEGAIGATDQYEYSVAWFCVPMEDGPEKTKIMKRLEAALNGKPEKAGGAEAAQFCVECGTKLPSDAKFCSKCGRKLA
ncbi:MAG: zinc ribbon domain-containing protein [Solobacterium sp.]|nr:zinc ribbon domain-containing protein [Solobacterium sp.]